MADLIAPHGGPTVPVNRTRDEVLPFNQKIVLSDADLANLYRIGDGELSPLIGPMTHEEWDRVLDEKVIIHDGKKYAWNIPIAFPITGSEAHAIKLEEIVGLENSKGEIVGTLHVKDIYPWDKAKYLKSVYGNERTDHPDGQMVMKDERTTLVGGEVWVKPRLK